MTRAVGRLQPMQVPAHAPDEPQLSTRLGDLIAKRTNPHPQAGNRGYEPDEQLRREAASKLSDFERLTRPLPELSSEPGPLPREYRLIVDWLKAINATVASPLPEKLFDARAEAIAKTLRDVPIGLWNGDTQREACKKFTYFPSAAEIYELVMADTKRIYAIRSALREVVAALAPPERKAMTPDERRVLAAHALRCAETVRAEMLARIPPELRADPKPFYLTRSQLRAAYAQQAEGPDPIAASAARTRLQMLGEYADATKGHDQGIDPVQ